MGWCYPIDMYKNVLDYPGHGDRSRCVQQQHPQYMSSINALSTYSLPHSLCPHAAPVGTVVLFSLAASTAPSGSRTDCGG